MADLGSSVLMRMMWFVSEGVFVCHKKYEVKMDIL
jgi:hypothetical protein